MLSHVNCFFTLLFVLHRAWRVNTEEFVPESTYHDYNELESFLKNISMTFPDITRLYSAGKSVQGRQLYVMVLGKYPESDVLLHPKVKYVGSMHGNEAVGKEILLNFIKYLAVSYETNSTVRQFLDTTQVHIMPSMNPDGFEITRKESQEGTCSGVVGRYNAENVDLNRNFPDYFVKNDVRRAEETRAIMDWLANKQFVLSANLHGGAMVANYPFDNYYNVVEQYRSVCHTNQSHLLEKTLEKSTYLLKGKKTYLEFPIEKSVYLAYSKSTIPCI